LSSGVVTGGQALGKVVNRGAEFLVSRTTPSEKPIEISEVSKKRIERAKMASGAAVKVSKALLIGAMATVSALSNQVSASVKETEFGKKLSEKGSERAEAAKEVAIQTVAAVAKIYESLEVAGLSLLGDVSQATVKVVHHKYGDEVASATKHGLGVVTDVSTATVQMRRVGLRAVAKATAIESTVGILSESQNRENKQNQEFPSAAMGAMLAMSEIQQAITGTNVSSQPSSSSSSSSSKSSFTDVD